MPQTEKRDKSDMEKMLYDYPPPEEPKAVPAERGRTITSIFFILFCIEIGLVLFLLPWTLLWDNNYFFSLTPQWNSFWLSTYLRGAISGVGVVNLWVGLGEAWRLWH